MVLSNLHRPANVLSVGTAVEIEEHDLRLGKGFQIVLHFEMHLRVDFGPANFLNETTTTFRWQK